MNDILIDTLKGIRVNLLSDIKALEPFRNEFFSLYDALEHLLRIVDLKLKYFSSEYSEGKK
jgi:hypothetical protein